VGDKRTKRKESDHEERAIIGGTAAPEKNGANALYWITFERRFRGWGRTTDRRREREERKQKEGTCLYGTNRSEGKHRGENELAVGARGEKVGTLVI